MPTRRQSIETERCYQNERENLIFQKTPKRLFYFIRLTVVVCEYCLLTDLYPLIFNVISDFLMHFSLSFSKFGPSQEFEPFSR